MRAHAAPVPESARPVVSRARSRSKKYHSRDRSVWLGEVIARGLRTWPDRTAAVRHASFSSPPVKIATLLRGVRARSLQHRLESRVAAQLVESRLTARSTCRSSARGQADRALQHGYRLFRLVIEYQRERVRFLVPEFGPAFLAYLVLHAAEYDSKQLTALLLCDPSRSAHQLVQWRIRGHRVVPAVRHLPTHSSVRQPEVSSAIRARS